VAAILSLGVVALAVTVSAAAALAALVVVVVATLMIEGRRLEGVGSAVQA